MLEDNCFYISIPAEAFTIIAIPKYRPTRHSTRSSCCLIYRKVKSFKQIVFLSGQSAVSKVTTSVRSAVFRPFT